VELTFEAQEQATGPGTSPVVGCRKEPGAATANRRKLPIRNLDGEARSTDPMTLYREFRRAGGRGIDLGSSRRHGDSRAKRHMMMLEKNSGTRSPMRSRNGRKGALQRGTAGHAAATGPSR